jgi:PAS domain S-box-containing protein
VGNTDLDKADFIFNNTADGLLAVDRQQRIVHWNEAAEVLLGFKARETLGGRCYEVIGGRDESGCLVCREACAGLAMALRREPVPNHNLLVRTKPGREVWTNVSTILMTSSRKHPFVLVHLFRDVSRQKETERIVERLLLAAAKFSVFPGTDSPITPRLPSLSMNHLTGREREVLRLLASGVSTKAVAQKLFISRFTARNHVQKILAKLKVHSRLEAATLALRNGLL